MRLLTVTIALLLGTSACEKERRPPIVPDEESAALTPWAAPNEVEPLVTEKPTGAPPTIGGTHRHPECWESFERDGEVVGTFPFADPANAAEHLASCGVEGYARLESGARAIAWGGEEAPGSRARELKLAVWEPDGKLRWSAALDRSREAPNWTANFRRSFVTPLPPKHICAGTMWEGDTQLFCVDLKTGASVFKGSLPFWSGIEPQTGEKGLIVADLSALSQRYVFTSEEMRYKKLEGLGGRAGYYATDGRRLYFAPSRVDAPPLIAYDLETFDEVWRTPLPGTPQATLSHAWRHLNRVLLKVDGTLFALDTETGKVAWGYEMGEDVGSIDADDDTIYVLSRRPEVPNRLTALDPVTGERKWSSDTPGGTLRVVVIDDFVFIGSIRAVQRVTHESMGDGD